MSEQVQVFMRNSERSTFRRCRLKWHWSYNVRLEPDRQKGALTFGTMIHEALAAYYPPGRKRGPHPAGVFDKLYVAQEREFNQWDEEGNKVPARELGNAMLSAYVDAYGADDHIEVLAPEMALQVDVYDAQGRYVCTWVGRGDALYKDLLRSSRSQPRYGFLEHKTAKTIETELSVVSGYGEQGLSYWWAGSIVLKDMGLIKDVDQIDHVLFNWLKKSLGSDKPRNDQGHVLNKPKKEALLMACETNGLDVPRKATIDVLWQVLEAAGFDPTRYGEVSKVQPSPLLHRYELDYGVKERQEINRRIRMEAGEMARVRDGRLPIYKNPTKDCKWDCPFHAACEVHEMGGDYESILELEFNEWSPYDGHELLEEKGR